MKSGKEEVMELLEQLPEDTSLEDIQYHIYMAGPGSSCRFHRSGFGNLRRCLCLGSDRVRKIPHTIR